MSKIAVAFFVTLAFIEVKESTLRRRDETDKLSERISQCDKDKLFDNFGDAFDEPFIDEWL